jgi:hypothetical protein
MAMGNFFTTERVIKMTREKGVGVMGTARNRINNDTGFNTWYVWQKERRHVLVLEGRDMPWW